MRDVDARGKVINNRDGGLNVKKAFNCTNSNTYYIIPKFFYSNAAEVEKERADTNAAGAEGQYSRLVRVSFPFMQWCNWLTSFMKKYG